MHAMKVIEKHFHSPVGSPEGDLMIELADRIEAYENFWYPDDGWGP